MQIIGDLAGDASPKPLHYPPFRLLYFSPAGAIICWQIGVGGTEMRTKQGKGIVYSLLQGFYWMGLGVAVSYCAVYLQGRGYSNSQLGLVMALGYIVSLLLSPSLASLVDSAKRVTVFHVSWILLMVQALVLLCLILIPGQGLSVSALYMLYIAACISGNPMLTQLSVELNRTERTVNYAAARGFGSIFYALGVLLLGYLAERFGSPLLPCAGLVILLLQAGALALLNLPGSRPALSGDSAEKQAGVSLGRFIRENRRFCVLLLGTAIVYFTHNLTNNYLINVVRHVGGGTGSMGALSCFMAVLEFPVMLRYNRFTRRFRCGSVLRFSLVFFALKALAIALAGSMAGLYAAHMLQIFSFALFTPTMVRYVNLHISGADSAKGQSLAYSMSTLGSVFASFLGGMLFDRISVTAVLFTGAAVSALGVLICQFSIEKEN